MIGDNSSASRISRNKAVLRNKLLKNAKSIQRNRCRSDNISAVIESVVRNYHENDKKKLHDDDSGQSAESQENRSKDAKEINDGSAKIDKTFEVANRPVRSKVMGRLKVLGKRRNVKTRIGPIGSSSQVQSKNAKLATLKARKKSMKFKSVAMSQTKADVSGEEVSSPKNTPKNAKMTPKVPDKDDSVNADGKRTLTTCNKNKSPSQSVSRRKRTVDPVASMNASIKAKSQLRTQDGKFARNPNKSDSPAKSPDTKTENEGKHSKTADTTEIKLKPKAAQKPTKRTELQPSRRVTRLSSDSDKMPTLEPAVQISSNEDYADKSANDLPILSPVTSSASLQEQKTSQRGNTKSSSTVKEKENNMQIDVDEKVVPEKPAKEQKPTRRRRLKEKTKDKRKEVDRTEEQETASSKNNSEKEGKTRRRSSLIKSTNIGDDKKEETSNKSEVTAKRESKWKREESTKETRSNSRNKLEKDTVNLVNIPFEVKKLLGSASKEDLLSTLELATNDGGLKRNLRQSTPRSNEKNTRAADCELDVSKSSSKKEKLEKPIRKSSRRNSEKRCDDKVKASLEKDATNNAMTSERAHQGRRGDGRTGTTKTKEALIDSSDIEGKIDSRQAITSSTCSRSNSRLVDAKNEPSTEVENDRKGNESSGKRRGRNKSLEKAVVETDITCTLEEEQNREETVTPGEKEPEKEVEKSIDKGDRVDKSDKIDRVNKSDKDDKMDKDNKINKSDKVDKDKDDEDDKVDEVEKTDKIYKVDKNEDKGNNNSNDHQDSAMMNLNLSHLLETSNSVDSGKENSLENSVNIHKLKATRPRKGARRERASRKRSLSNVIGILTEGMNIPVEAQQSVVLTVQTSLDNDPDRLTRSGVTQQPTGENNVVAVDSFNELVPSKGDESSENEVATTNAIAGYQHADDNERNSHPSLGKAQDGENAFPSQKIDVSPMLTNVKAHSPANDIILDLSRRKHKSKGGSFLEKIVSKIAKQKDALLEGEVGSLLDTAADELTSILDEVGTGLTENRGSTSPNEMSNNKNPMDTSIDVENECVSNLLKIQDNLEEKLPEKTETQTQIENQIKMSGTNSEVKINDNDVEENPSDAIHAVEKSPIESCENQTALNEEAIVPTQEPSEIPTATAETLTEVSSSSSDSMQKISSKKVEERENGKRSRKSRKRPNASSPKKSKSKSVKVVEKHVEENAKELQLDDIVQESQKAANGEDELSERDSAVLEISNMDSEYKIEKIQNNEDKAKDDPNSLDLGRNLTNDCDESILEKSADLPEPACEDIKELITNFQEPATEITSENTIIDVQSRDAIEICADDSLEKSVKDGKSTEKTQRKNQNSTSEPVSKHTSKKKSQPALSPTLLPVDTAVDILQFPESDKTEELLSTMKQKEVLEPIDEQPTETNSTISENLIVSAEKSLSSMEEVPEKPEETQPTTDLSNLVDPSLPKMTKKKRGRKKKKSLADEHLELPDDEPVKIASKLNGGQPSIAEANGLSASLEHFKVPEVLQSTKKRGVKRKSSGDGRWNGSGVPEETRVNEEPHVSKVSDTSSMTEKSEETDEADKKNMVEKESSAKEPEKSTSSDSVGLAASSKTRSTSRRKQQSSYEDLADPGIHGQSAESTDDLSESSCTSESSYFRKKRFAKKKKKEKEEEEEEDEEEDEEAEENESADEKSLTDSSAANTKPSSSNEQRSKEKTKSLLDEHLNLSDTDDLDVPVDTEVSFEETKALIDISKDIVLPEKSSGLPDESANKTTDAVTDETTEDNDSSAILKQAADNCDLPDNLVTPKKRTAGNFVVVHTKSGEILIVEKRKKLTKETAKFFCDLCTTSFTRKSSLKKHTQSQSHLSQMSKSTKVVKVEPANDNNETKNVEETSDWQSNEMGEQQVKSEENIPKLTGDALEANESYTAYTTNAESTNSLMDLRASRQQSLEDELLDEEICKITENMSHDEYVLTDHITPQPPEASSTPVKQSTHQKSDENLTRRRHGEKKRNKSKKRNLAEEHLLLESPELAEFKVDLDRFPKPANNPVRVSPSPLLHSSSPCEHDTSKDSKDVSEETLADSTKTKDQAELTVMNVEEVERSKLSVCDINMKDEEQMESTRTTRRNLKRHPKVYNKVKEENQVVSSLDGDTSSSRFSLRPRRSKKIQHYDESDIDMYFMDNSMEMNEDGTNDNHDAEARLNEMEVESRKDELQETTESHVKEHVDPPSENLTIARSKLEPTKTGRKRGRPRLKDRVIPSANIATTPVELKANETNDVIEKEATLKESKMKDQKLSSHVKEHSQETCKPQDLSTNVQPPKPRRGRPKKNVTQITNISPVEADISTASTLVSMKPVPDEAKKKTEEATPHSETAEEAAPPTPVDSSTPNVELLPAAEDHTPDLNSLKTKKSQLNIEEDELRFTELKITEEQSVQEVGILNAEVADVASEENKECEEFNILSGRDNVIDRSDDVECVLKDKPCHEETKENILITPINELPAEFSTEIAKETPSDALQVAIAIDTSEPVESEVVSKDAEIQESELERICQELETGKETDLSNPGVRTEETNSSDSEPRREADLLESLEETLTKSGKESPEEEICEPSQKEEATEPKLLSESDNSENEAVFPADDKSLPVANSHKSPSQKTTADFDEKTVRPAEKPSKKVSKSSQSANKEREANRKKSRSSKGKSKKITVKVTELSSESENEGKIESASSNKSKIVKSVFGRVFGGEKADKVKEVLNDWVSRSEDDSDVSRSAACLHGSAKIPENDHRKDKKRHTSSDAKKDAERPAKKKRNDKGNSADVHGKSKNRKKREKDFNAISTDHPELSVNSAKRKRRENKVRADEKILRAFDDKSPVLAEENDRAVGIEETRDVDDRFHDSYSNDKDEQSQRKLSSTDDWENLRASHDAHGKSKTNSNCRKKREDNTRNERSPSPSQFNVFKYRRRESKSKADVKAWKVFDNNGTSSCLFDDRDTHETHETPKEWGDTSQYESRDGDRSSNWKSVRRKDGDAWKNANSEDEKQARTSSGRGRSKKNSSSRKRQISDAAGKIDKTKTNEKATKNLDNSSLTRTQETKNGTQDDQTARPAGESKNRSKNADLEFPSYRDLAPKYTNQDQDKATVSRRSKKGHANEDWKHSARNSVAFDQEVLVEDDRLSEKDIAQRKNEESAVSSRSGSSLASEGSTMRDQTDDADGVSQAVRESDEEEEENDDDERRRMSPFYARDTPDNSMDSSSNNEEEEEEDEEEDEERIAQDSTKKMNTSEFSGEKIVIRSPSSGHRSDVVTIAPTDAIEDNALDVPREIESTTEPRQGKILNFDEELFVECCSRLKATSENELRGAKKIKLDHTESYHRRNDQPQGFRTSRDRWRDVESQNSLGSLLESVNQVNTEFLNTFHSGSFYDSNF